MSRLKVLLLITEHHLGSEIATLSLLHNPHIDVVGALICNPAKNLSAALRHARKMGAKLTSLLVLQQFTKFLTLSVNKFRSPPPHQTYLTPIRHQLAKRNIPYLHTADVNSLETRCFAQQRDPDLLFSAFFSQILKQEMLAVPNIGAINLHPGDIETYRGAMSYFWAIRNRERESAATLHWMDTGIDTGAVIEKAPVKISQEDTQFSLLQRLSLRGIRTLNRILKSGNLPLRKIPSRGKYYSVPTHTDYLDYSKTRLLFTWREVFDLFQPISPSYYQ